MDDGGSAADEVERLAAVMDAEVRAEQAAYEAMALHAEWRARTLAAVAAEWLVRGDVIEVRAVDQQLAGTVIHSGEDYAVLQTRRGPTDIALARCDLLRVVQRVPDGGRPPGRGARTFNARLTEHEIAATPVCLLIRNEGEVHGIVDAVALDHVLLRTRRGQVVVPELAVVAAWPSAGQC